MSEVSTKIEGSHAMCGLLKGEVGVKVKDTHKEASLHELLVARQSKRAVENAETLPSSNGCGDSQDQDWQLLKG